MKKFICLITTLCLGVASLQAIAGASDLQREELGSRSLIFASLVGENSPNLSPSAKKYLSKVLNGDRKGIFKAKKILVKADAVECKTSSAAVGYYSCEISFGNRIVGVKNARSASHLYTLLESLDADGDGALGTFYMSLRNVNCEIDPLEISENTGGGASCQYVTGPRE